MENTALLKTNKTNSVFDISFTVSDLLWFLYFTIMFNFYTYTYVQLLAQFVIIAHTLWYCFISKHGKIKVSEGKRLLQYFLWYGLFTIWCFLSLFWTVYNKGEGNTLLTVLRVFVMGGCLVWRIKDRKDLDRFIYLFILSGILFCILTIISNPISAWGKEAFYSIDSGYMRNSVANFALFLLIFTIFYKIKLNRWIFNLSLVLNIITIALCGSRRVIVLLALFICLYILTMKNLKKKLQVTFIVLTVGLVLLIIASNIPYIQETYIKRIAEMFSGVDSSDGSTAARSTFIEIGIQMFFERPLFGWGRDAFYNHLLENQNLPYSFRPVYSHNNFVEVLVSFGLVGFIIFYSCHIKTLYRAVKNRKNDLSRMVFIVTALFLIGDYGSINFSGHIAMYILIFVFCAGRIIKNEGIRK